MKTLFSDNSRSNTEIRTHNVSVLRKSGFKDGGLYSTSGNLYLVKKETKWQMVFGKRYNIGSKKGNKYFSLAKDYKTEAEAMKDFNKFKTKLKKS
ncbi:MAG: hypothetical protein PHX80_05230 [Candidatus Nanoarchaeia archaeon]|nr:hypothetical protein [Candidatus Nanoarchaeia archaeon]